MADTISKAIRFVLLGDDKGATNALKSTGRAFTKTAGQAGGLGGKVKMAGAMVGSALIAAGAAAVKFGADAVGHFKKVAGETMALKRVTGMTTEDASRLGFSLKQSGVDGQVGAKSLTIFSKNLMKMAESDDKAKVKSAALADKTRDQIAQLEAAGPKTKGYADKLAALKEKLAGAEAGAKLNTSALGDLGVKYTDANGKMLPMSQLLPGIADKFSKMADGPEKSALAMKLFGKSGTAMLPFLNKGAAGLAELAKKSDQFGNTLNDKQLQALKDSKQAQRDWDAAMGGLQTTLGAELLPLLTQGAQFLNSVMVPAFQSTKEWVSQNQGAFDAMGNGFRWVWNKLLLPVIKALIWGGAEIGKVYGQAVAAIGAAIGNKDMQTMGEAMTRNAQAAEDWGNSLKEIPDQVTPKLTVNDQVTAPVKAIDKQIQSVKDKIVKAKAKGDTKDLDKLQTKLNALKDKKVKVTTDINLGQHTQLKLQITNHGTVKLGYLATGGRARKGQPYIVGEKGPELWTPDSAGYMLNAARTAALARASQPGAFASAGGQAPIYIAVTIEATPGTDRAALGREVIDLLAAAQKTQGKELNIG